MQQCDILLGCAKNFKTKIFIATFRVKTYEYNFDAHKYSEKKPRCVFTRKKLITSITASRRQLGDVI